MSWTNPLRFGVAKILSAGVEVLRRAKVNFLAPLVASDNSTLQTTDVYLAEGTTTGQLYRWGGSAWELSSNVGVGSGYIALGSDPAQTGPVRLTEGEYIYSRIATSDRTLIGTAGSSVQVGDSAVGTTYVRAATSVSLSISGNNRLLVYGSYAQFNFGDADTYIADGFIGLNGVSSGTGFDAGGLPLRNFHDAISATTPQTVAASGTPGYIPLQINSTATSILLSALGFTAASGSVRPTSPVGWRVTWRYDDVANVEVADEIQVNVRVRYAASSDYRASVWAPTDGDPAGVSESATANAAVSTIVYGASGAAYQVTVSPDSGGAHAVSIAMLQHATTDRIVMAEMWRGATVRNIYT